MEKTRYSNGLLCTTEGFSGQTYQTTSDIHAARERHERLLDFVDSCVNGPAGGRLLLMLPCNEIVLNFDALKQATSGGAMVYQISDLAYLEWEMENGWRERRQCSKQTACVIQENDGPMVSKSDWKWASDQLRTITPEFSDAPWEMLIGDAQAWWYERLSGPTFGHASRAAPFQLLDRAALARRITGLPQIAHPDEDVEILDKRLGALDTTYARTDAIAAFSSLVRRVNFLANAKVGKPEGRRKILTYIDGLIPIAQTEGRDQVLMLLATAHAIQFGGVSGILWAPITISNYTRLAEKHLMPAWIKTGEDKRTGQFMLELYSAAIQEVLVSQRRKFAAYLEAFHRFLVIVGYEPLPKPISGRGAAAPPDATDVCPKAQDRTVRFIDHFAPSEQVRLQCNVKVRAAAEMPLRSYEPWCFRLNDIHDSEPIYVEIYPRRVDGQGKNVALRRQEGVEDLSLNRDLIDLKNLRLAANAKGDDLLFGEPGKPGVRHEQVLCQRLINAALRWATGNSRASFYDLRHTIFTERAQSHLAGGPDGSKGYDGFSFADMSTRGGHAGPESTYPYINRVESSIAYFSQTNRPSAWQGVFDVSKVNHIFADLVDEIIDFNPQSLDACAFEITERPPIDSLGIAKRHEVLDKIADDLLLTSVAGESQVPPEIVRRILHEFAQISAQIGVVGYDCTRSERGQLDAVMAQGLWALHARQPKYKSISSCLNGLASSKNYAALNQLWQSWLIARDHEFLSLTRPRAAMALIKFLFKCGFTKRNLIVVSEPGAISLDREIASLGLPARTEKVDRNGRAAHRLFFTASGIDAEKANAATISTRGFNWWMLMVGSFLLSNDQI